MAATITTRTIKDGAGATFTQQVLDVSGSGAGPFLPVMVVGDSTGAALELGQKVMAASLPVVMASDQSTVKVGNKTTIGTANFTRPADTTAYAIGDLVANSTTAGSVTPMTLTVTTVSGGTAAIYRVRLQKSTTSVTNSTFRVHFYSTIPTVTNGDNGAWLSTQSATYLGACDVLVDKAFSDGAAGISAPNNGSAILFAAGTTTVFALLEARAAYTPGNAEVFTLLTEGTAD